MPEDNITMVEKTEFQDFLRNTGSILIIGSGSLDCYPRPGCRDPLCQIARKGGKDKRLCATSIFYKDCLIDIGTGVWERLQQRGLVPKGIAVSHTHFDHIADLLYLPKISREFPISASSLDYSLFNKIGIKANYFQPNTSFSIGKLRFDSLVAVHTFTRPVSIFKFDNIVYAPDLGEIDGSLLEWAKGTKIWLADGFSFEDDFVLQGEKLHLSIEKQLLRLKNLKGLDMVLFLGIGHHSFYPHEDLEIYVKKFAIDNKLPFSVEIGFDWQIITP